MPRAAGHDGSLRAGKAHGFGVCVTVDAGAGGDETVNDENARLLDSLRKHVAEKRGLDDPGFLECLERTACEARRKAADLGVLTNELARALTYATRREQMAHKERLVRMENVLALQLAKEDLRRLEKAMKDGNPDLADLDKLARLKKAVEEAKSRAAEHGPAPGQDRPPPEAQGAMVEREREVAKLKAAFDKARDATFGKTDPETGEREGETAQDGDLHLPDEGAHPDVVYKLGV